MKMPLCIVTVLMLGTLVFSAPSVMAMQGAAIDSQIGYMLGPNDQITIRAMDAEEISDKPFRISSNGDLTLPMIGTVKAAGLTLQQLEAALVSALKPYVRRPKVAATVLEFQSQPVSVIGAVTTPGVHQLQGNKTLVEVLSMVGGARSDAGPTVMITRRQEWGPLPLAGAITDPSGQFSIGEVKLKDLIEARSPEQNISIRPNDIISVPRAQIFYVLGAVKRTGGFPLNERGSLSVLEAISLAEGLDRTAAPRDAKILRVNPGEMRRTEIAVNIEKIVTSKTEDVVLQPDDILFVPDSKGKRAALRTLEALTSMGTSIGVGTVLIQR